MCEASIDMTDPVTTPKIAPADIPNLIDQRGEPT